ncbi:MAG: iron ABC transporter permease [Propionibacteriaceae bacterium]|nr:iron ABC transporter permease [Propionibacteriaceae bacterium]
MASALKTLRGTLKRLTVPLVAVILALTAVSVVYSVNIGSETLDSDAVWKVVISHLNGTVSDDPAVEAIVWELRLPRALLSVIVGAGLGIAGCGMQTLVRNPLADPYLLGVSAGASVGATAVITFGVLSSFGLWSISVGALLGSLGAALAVYLVAMAQGGLTPIRLVLSGVVLSSAFSAIASFLVFKGPDPRAAQSVLFWLLGSVSGAQWDRLALPAIVVLVCLLLMLLASGWLDALAWGPDAAAALGVPVGWVRQMLFLLLAVLVGVLVAVSGGIGFVGLVIPHLCRMVVGSVHRRLLPVAAAVGGLFLLWVDVASRVIVAPAEVPLGVVTGLIGAPVFLIVMGRRSYGFGGAA